MMHLCAYTRLSTSLVMPSLNGENLSPANCPHKLTKTAEPWLGGGAAFGRLRTARGRHVGCSSLPPSHVSRGSRRAAGGGRRGGRLLQLRVSTLGGCV